MLPSGVHCLRNQLLSDSPRYWTPAFVERSVEAPNSDEEFQDTAGSFPKTVELRCLDTPCPSRTQSCRAGETRGRDGPEPREEMNTFAFGDRERPTR